MAYSEYNAFTGGVEPGGLRNVTEIRLIVCYILSKANGMITKENILFILQKDGIANYFEINTAITELIKNNHLETKIVDDIEYYFITELGKTAVKTLQSSLPFSIKEKTAAATLELLARLKKEKENIVKIEKFNNGYYVTCDIFDGTNVLLSTKLYVTDKDQANLVKEEFINNAEIIYKAIMTLYTHDYATFGDYVSKEKTD
jgi:hypothetical protein